MRNLPASLLTAQQSESRTPYVEVKASHKTAGIVRLDWEQFYSGGEDDYFHSATMPENGSLIRVRITPPANGRKLYRQTIANPGATSDFSAWTYTGQYNAVVTAAASLSAEVSIFWTNSSREIHRIVSSDNGATWGNPQLVDYSPTTAINGISAAYKPNGDLALFFADQSTLYVKKLVGGTWQPKAAWDKTTGELTGAATAYSRDWNLMVTGKDTGGKFKLWSLIYGDGGDFPAGTWSALKEFASAPADGFFEYAHAAMAKPDVFRCFYVETFTGEETYSRPFWSTTVLDASFGENLWREPEPFDLESQYGLALTCHGDFAWLTSPNCVWRASLSIQTIDLSAEVTASRVKIEPGKGEINVEIINSPDGVALTPGCQIEFNPGCATSEGNEVSAGQTFSLEAIEKAKSSVLLYGFDGWRQIRGWTARHQFRWNRDGEDACVRDILAFVLARSSLKLEIITQSDLASGFYPDFNINPGDNGSEVIGKLLFYIPDLLFIEGHKAFLVHPQPDDDSVYACASTFSCTNTSASISTSRVRIEGEDDGSKTLLADSFNWDEIHRTGEKLEHVTDRNISTVEIAAAWGEGLLRKAEVFSESGSVLVPVNCGLQLYDVIEVSNAGIFRVIGIDTTYDTHRGIYTQRLRLGRV